MRGQDDVRFREEEGGNGWENTRGLLGTSNVLFLDLIDCVSFEHLCAHSAYHSARLIGVCTM